MYPTYKSIQSINSDVEDDDKQWLTYWAVYGIFVIVDTYAQFILGYFPHYFLLKLLFTVWLMSPTTKGALIVYNGLLWNLFLKYKDSIDQGINKLKEGAIKIGKHATEFATDPKNIQKGLYAVNEVKTKIS